MAAPSCAAGGGGGGCESGSSASNASPAVGACASAAELSSEQAYQASHERYAQYMAYEKKLEKAKDTRDLEALDGMALTESWYLPKEKLEQREHARAMYEAKMRPILEARAKNPRPCYVPVEAVVGMPKDLLVHEPCTPLYAAETLIDLFAGMECDLAEHELRHCGTCKGKNEADKTPYDPDTPVEFEDDDDHPAGCISGAYGADYNFLEFTPFTVKHFPTMKSCIKAAPILKKVALWSPGVVKRILGAALAHYGNCHSYALACAFYCHYMETGEIAPDTDDDSGSGGGNSISNSSSGNPSGSKRSRDGAEQ